MTPATSKTGSNLQHDSQYQRKRWLVGLTVFFLIVGLLFVLYWVLIGRFYESTDDAYVNGNLVQVMPETSGYVTSISADETQLVKKGDPIVTLDKADADIALKNAEAHLAITAREVGQLYINVDQAKAAVSIQRNNFEKATQDYKRRQGLVVNKTISSEDLQHYKLAMEGAADGLELAKRQLEAAVDLVQNVDLYHHPKIIQAAQSFRNAYLALERTIIYAAETGHIAKRPVQVGQQVSPNSVLMVIVPLDQIWIDANFKETQLENIRIGQPVELNADVYGSGVTYKGTVVGLSPGTGSAFDLLPAQNATGNWIKIVQRLPVRIKIDPTQLEKYPLQVGLSMSVSINTHDRRGEILAKMSHKNVIYQTVDYNAELKKADQRISEIIQTNAANASYKPSNASDAP